MTMGRRRLDRVGERLVDAPAPCALRADVGDEDDACLHRDAEEREEADAGGDGAVRARGEERGEAADGEVGAR